MSLAFDDELVGPALDKDQIQRRVADWQLRVNELISSLKTWSRSAGLSARDSEPVTPTEELMTEFGVSAVELPTLYIEREGEFLAKVVPFGLWIIGGNGRVDLKTKRGVYKIVDMAERFEAPLWRFAGPGLRDAPSLDETTFRSALDI